MLSQLKLATEALHARVELAMPTLDELSRRLRYVQCLRDFYALYALWEPAIWQTPGVADVVTDGAARQKLPLLVRDLKALGQAVTDVPFVVDDASSDLPANCAEALGALYVLEGATLGGRVILRHIAGPLDLPLDGGLAFFNGYGARTGPMWTSFGRALEHYSDTGGDVSASIAGATRCFTAFESWFRSRGTAAGAAPHP
ncbi:MAG: biliverdin-producing heme oxygenase [Gemmatimonadaceae bacterium]